MGDSGSCSSTLQGFFSVLKTHLLYKDMFAASNRKYNLHCLTHALLLVTESFRGRTGFKYVFSHFKLHFSLILFCSSLIYAHFISSLVSIMQQVGRNSVRSHQPHMISTRRQTTPFLKHRSKALSFTQLELAYVTGPFLINYSARKM